MIFVEAEVAKNSWPQRIISYPPPLEATYINRGVHILQKVASTTDRNNGQVAVGKVWGRCGQHTCVRVARERQPRWKIRLRQKFGTSQSQTRTNHSATKRCGRSPPRWSPPHIDPCGDAAFAAFRSRPFGETTPNLCD